MDSRSPTESDGDLRRFLEEDEVGARKISLERQHDLRQRGPEILRQRAFAALPAIEVTLDRALSKTFKDQKGGKAATPFEALPFRRFLELEEALHEIDRWKPYLSKSSVVDIAELLRGRKEKVLDIIDEYRSWALGHEPRRESDRNTFEAISLLHELEPATFPRSLITLTDQQFREIGSPSLTAAIQPIRLLSIHSRLATYDPARFKRAFGQLYDESSVSEREAYYARWERGNPLAIPKANRYLSTIKECMAG